MTFIIPVWLKSLLSFIIISRSYLVQQLAQIMIFGIGRPRYGAIPSVSAARHENQGTQGEKSLLVWTVTSPNRKSKSNILGGTKGCQAVFEWFKLMRFNLNDKECLLEADALGLPYKWNINYNYMNYYDSDKNECKIL